MSDTTDVVRHGRQTPTISVVLPYSTSKGMEAVAIYNRSGRTAQPWQELMLEDIMAQNDAGLWTHMKYGWSIPRRNGKSEVLIICCLPSPCSRQSRAKYTSVQV